MLTVTEPGSITVVTCRNGHNPRSHSGAIRLPFLLIPFLFGESGGDQGGCAQDAGDTAVGGG